MYGDASAIRHLAGRLRDRADEIRAAAARLADHIDQAPWHGLAADAMRHHTHAQLAALRETARLHDDAADALDRHAREVQRLQDLIAAIEHKARGLVDSACARLAKAGGDLVRRVTGAAPDPVDELLAHFRPPPPGHLAWLSVDLPGL
jgi:uncharacterized protein YukE